MPAAPDEAVQGQVPQKAAAVVDSVQECMIRIDGLFVRVEGKTYRVYDRHGLLSLIHRASFVLLHDVPGGGDEA